MNTVRMLLLAAVVALVWSCKPQVPRHYVQPDEMEDIIYDCYVAKAMAARSDNVDYNQRLYRLAVFKKHGVTEADFDSSLVYYFGDAERLKKIYDAVAERMEGTATQLGATAGEMNKYASLSATGDTADIWNGASRVLMLPVAPYNRFDFTLEADSSYRVGDQFQLNLNALFLYQGGTKEGVIYVAVDYEGDSTAVFTSRIYSTGIATLRIQRNTEAQVKRLRGFVYLGNGGTQSPLQKLLFIDGIQLIRFHATDGELQAAEEQKRKNAQEKARQDSLLKADTIKGGKAKAVVPLQIKKELAR